MSQLDLPTVLDALLSAGRRLDAGGRLSRTAASTLATLAGSAPARLSDLARTEAVSQPAMTGLVGRLERSGLVERASDPADGRVVLVGITDAGRDLVAARRRTYAATVAGLVDRLDDDERLALERALPALRHLTVLARAETGAVHLDPSEVPA